MANTMVVSHADDIDGVGSASLLKLRYHLDSKDLFFVNHSQVDFENTFRRITPRLGKGAIVFFTDLSLNDNLLGMVSSFVRSVNSKGGTVIWLDHHHWSDQALNEVAKKCETAIVGENKYACATDITKRYTRLTGEFVERFVSLVHCIDLYLGFDSQSNPTWSRSAARTYTMCINRSRQGELFRREAEATPEGRRSHQLGEVLRRADARRSEELRAHQ